VSESVEIKKRSMVLSGRIMWILLSTFFLGPSHALFNYFAISDPSHAFCSLCGP